MDQFESGKEKALSELASAHQKGWFDKKFDRIIFFLNYLDCVYTTSCCSGRISIYHADINNSKKEHEFLGKFHDIPDFSEIVSSIGRASKDMLYYNVDPMILHVCCKDIETAGIVLDCAYFIGFKRSGIFQVKKKIMLEIRGVDGFSVPVGRAGSVLVNEDYLRFLLDVSKIKLQRNWNKMDLFYSKLKDAF